MAVQLHQREHNQTVLSGLQVGDLIEFPRGYYSHWGVFVGNDDIVHLAGEDTGNDGINGKIDSGHLFTVCGKRFNKAYAKVDNFWDVVADSRAKINNNKDKKCKPYAPDEVKERALSKIGAIPYNVLWSNCEHFAAWCRNGENWSQQVDTVLSWIVGIGTAFIAGALAYAGLSNTKKKAQKS